MVAILPVTFLWRDYKGLTGWTRMYNQFTTAANVRTRAANQMAILRNSSDAVLYGIGSGGYTSPVAVTYGGVSSYGSIQDKAALVFQTASGTLYTLYLPAPKPAIFMPDGETVNQSLVQSIITNTIGSFWCTRHGERITAFIGGYRLRRKSRRKAGLYVKAPGLLTPGGAGG